MSIPRECTVLVVGGGPAGSYAASVLAREGIDTVVLEADTFPRYHIGESLLPSMRYFLDHIDLYSKFDSHGFQKKKGAAFKFLSTLPSDEYTDFIASGGAGHHAWNVVRSEADNILFEHAGDSGAKVFDGVKVNTVQFAHQHTTEGFSVHDEDQVGRPDSASWSRKDGSTGDVRFEYLVDASGRAGLLATRYMKIRHYNQGLKSTATWGYWEGAGKYGEGTHREGDPYFEAIKDGSGWVWFIPLHNNTTSVGVVIRQDRLASRKRAKSSAEFYQQAVEDTPGIARLLQNARLTSELKSASDWSYHASAYAGPFFRICGDAGCFIDPLFSSGVHLAIASGLSAAVTICAARKGDCSEAEAGNWHTRKVAEGYTRFLLIVTSALRQIYGTEEHVLNELGESDFTRAFENFKPIIQGHVDLEGKLNQEEIDRAVEFCVHVLQKADQFGGPALESARELGIVHKGFAGGVGKEKVGGETLKKIVHMARGGNSVDEFRTDVINGMAPNISRGRLGLVKVDTA
ncbi:conserved hypothetical protein [Aspergillus terreus NIH2624]|uniref:FAD-binding domain-containing protein n=1 Tax=Aspergillus terreus (strain NIH 2624 / FGSC A1156) TaxID=341663 RepID=Q0CU46_ASPTN|nr:uncharacterized protein ATEG_02788 [Aspergillus terreus NIH2624]EAU36062.1 conserved hypothetical protein [Aspergillus terreus NIH2624]